MDASINRAGGTPPPNPYVWESTDYQGNVIGISIVWDAESGDLEGAIAYRHQDCVYRKIYFGIGGDGAAEGGHVINVAAGTANVPAGQLHASGMDTISDVVAGQITAGP